MLLFIILSLLQNLDIYPDEIIAAEEFVASDTEDNLDWPDGIRRWVNR